MIEIFFVIENQYWLYFILYILPVRHQKNIIWTEASEVHIIFFW